MAPTIDDSASEAGALSRNRRLKLIEQIQSPDATFEEKQADAPPSLATTFKQDLEGIKSYVTCTICHQLLYEPWTLGCGHTYCYSCLCTWFAAKKTCPDCRARVIQMPAAAYLVKQIVDTFINRSELMPADESIEQHKQNRKEETDMVAVDRASPEGLFKGCFRRHTEGTFGGLSYDEEDGILRCADCGHEYEGGGICNNCGMDVSDDEAFPNDMSEAEMESEIDSELGFDEDGMDDMAEEHDVHIENYPWLATTHLARENGSNGLPGSIHVTYTPASQIRRLREAEERQSSRRRSPSEPSESEDEGSLRDLVVNDDDEVHRPSPIRVDSSDESDEGGDIVPRRRRRGFPSISSSSPMRNNDDSEAPESPNGNLQRGFTHSPGDFSPLDEDSEEDDDVPPSVGRLQADDSDTNTMTGNQDDSSEHSSNSEDEAPMSPTSRRHHDLQRVLRNSGRDMRSSRRGPGNVPSSNRRRGGGYTTFDDSESVMDEDGDVEMESSPGVSRASSVASPASVEVLGTRRNVIDLDEDSSDGSIRPPVRRRRAYQQQSHASNYSNLLSRSLRGNNLLASRGGFGASSRYSPVPFVAAEGVVTPRGTLGALSFYRTSAIDLELSREYSQYRRRSLPSSSAHAGRRTPTLFSSSAVSRYHTLNGRD